MFAKKSTRNFPHLKKRKKITDFSSVLEKRQIVKNFLRITLADWLSTRFMPITVDADDDDDAKVLRNLHFFPPTVSDFRPFISHLLHSVTGELLTWIC